PRIRSGIIRQGRKVRLMPRKTGLLLAASLLVVLALCAASSLVHVTPDSHVLLRPAFGGGDVRVLDPGWHMRVPFAQVLHRYPGGASRLEGVEEFSSPEGGSLRPPFSFSGRSEPSRLAIFDEHARGRDARVFIREAVR